MGWMEEENSLTICGLTAYDRTAKQLGKKEMNIVLCQRGTRIGNVAQSAIGAYSQEYYRSTPHLDAKENIGEVVCRADNWCTGRT